MNQWVVVTEGESDAFLLQTILQIAPSDPRVRVEAAGGWSGADSYARTLLMTDEANVALVVDADSHDPNKVEERKHFLHRSLGQVNLHQKFGVFVIKPQIVGMLFEHRSIIETLIGKPVSEMDMIEARYEPDKVLKRLLPKGKLVEILQTKLPQIDLTPLAELPAMRRLKKFLHPAERRVAVSR